MVALAERNEVQIWPAPHSIAITQIVQTPQTRQLHFFLVGGDLGELRQLYPIILEFGRAMQCERATLLGRRGWERTFLTKDEGWEAPLVYMTKEL